MTSNVSGPGQNSPVSQPFAPVQGARAYETAGQWNGMTVSSPDDPMSLIAAAAEELPLAAGESVAREVAERKPAGRQKHNFVPPSGSMEFLQRQITERLTKLLDRAKLLALNPAALRQLINNFSGDLVERHVALAWLENEFADSPSLADMIKRERAALETESGRELQAGYNILDVDAAAVGGPERGRAAYQRTILGYKDVSAMLEEVLARCGEADFADTVDFLRRAVGTDLSAATPSTDKRELEAMNNDLYQLRALANFIREFDAELTALRAEGGKPPLPAAGVGTLRLFCKAKNERLILLDPLKSVLALEGRGDPTYDVRALTQSFRLAHQLPAKLFTDEDSRQRLLAANQKLLDAAVNLEEDVLGGGT